MFLRAENINIDCLLLRLTTWTPLDSAQNLATVRQEQESIIKTTLHAF